MNDSTPNPTDPLSILRTLDADAIARRLEELGAEEAALRVLLRSARARQNARGRTHHPPRGTPGDQPGGAGACRNDDP